MRPFILLASLLAALPLFSRADEPAPAPVAAQATDVAAVSTTPALTASDAESWLDGFLPYAIGRADIPGAVVVVVKDGKILVAKGYGYADVAARTPVNPASTLFRPGSVSKLLTWTAVMQLVEQGKLDLDTDINKYLDFEMPPFDGKPVTLRNIMTHTSGIEETARGLITGNPKDAIAIDDYVKVIPTRIFEPGTTPSYSNYATTLAGYIVQRVSGLSFDDYIDQHLLAPLDMQHASFRQPLPSALEPFMSKGYEPGSEEPKAFEFVNPAPAGSLSASGEDMGHFMIAHLQNGAYGNEHILEAATAKQMHETALDILPPLHRMLLGFYEEGINGHRVISHAGDTQWFHSNLNLFLDDGVGLFTSFNSSGKEAGAQKIRSELFKQFADRYMPGPIAEGDVDIETAKIHAQQIAGVYANSRRADYVFTSLTNLLGQATVAPDGKGSIIVASITDLTGNPVKWREIAPFVWRDINSGNRLAAKLEDGKVVRFSVEPISPFMVFDRVAWWKSSALLIPALLIALGALLLTVLAWPISAMVRRHYGVRYELADEDASAHRVIRITALLVAGVMLAAMITIVMMLGSLDLLSPGNDWLVHLLRVLALIVFPIGTLAAFWSASIVLRRRRRFLAKLWSIVLALSCLVVLWIGIAFGLMGWSAYY